MAVSTEKTTALYKQVEDSAVFSGIKLEIFKYLCNSRGLTVGEIYNRYSRDNPDHPERSRSELSKRVSDLANLGVIKRSGKVVCPYSNKKVTRWVVTGATPRVEVTEDGRKRLLRVERPAEGAVEVVVAPVAAQEIITPVYLFDRDREILLEMKLKLEKSFWGWRRYFRRQKTENEFILKISTLELVLNNYSKPKESV